MTFCPIKEIKQFLPNPAISWYNSEHLQGVSRAVIAHIKSNRYRSKMWSASRFRFLSKTNSYFGLRVKIESCVSYLHENILTKPYWLWFPSGAFGDVWCTPGSLSSWNCTGSTYHWMIELLILLFCRVTWISNRNELLESQWFDIRENIEAQITLDNNCLIRFNLDLNRIKEHIGCR